MKTIFIFAGLLMLAAIPVTAQDTFTEATVLHANEAHSVICDSGAHVVFYHPTLTDGVSPDMRKLVVECPATAQGIIWVEGRPVSPLALPTRADSKQSIYLPLIGGFE